MKNYFVRLKKTITASVKRMDIGAQAAQLAFYLLMSLVPLLLVVGNLIPMLSISYDSFMNYLAPILPENIKPLIEQILRNYLNSYSGSSIFMGVLIALWSSSQAFNVMQHVFNNIYDTKPRKNFLVTRLLSFLMVFVFIFVIMLVGLILSYGSTVLRLLQEFTLIREGIAVIFNNFKWIVAFIILLVGFTFLYYIMPNIKRPLKYVFPGALVAAIGMLLVSQLYSIYVSFATSSALTDGTIGIFIVLMLWLYVMSMVILLGAWINVWIYDYRHTSV